MSRTAIIGVVAGLGLALILLATNDFGRIAEALLTAGWGVSGVVALHLPQTLFSALGWQPLIDTRPPARLWLIYRLRWVRESVNALLPVAQIGGDVVRGRLLAQRGTPLKTAMASSVVDLSVEMATQIVFTVFGLGLLFVGPHAGGIVPLAIGVTAAGGAIAGSFIAAQRMGALRLFERFFAKISAGATRAFVSDLNDAVIALYRQPRRLTAAAALHLLSWALGGVETWAALRVLGVDAGFREPIVIEGLGQAVRGLAFFIPAALGVQEGGYLLICGIFGMSPQNALALSLMRRIRELALGIPGLIVWQAMAARPRRQDCS